MRWRTIAAIFVIVALGVLGGWLLWSDPAPLPGRSPDGLEVSTGETQAVALPDLGPAENSSMASEPPPATASVDTAADPEEEAAVEPEAKITATVLMEGRTVAGATITMWDTALLRGIDVSVTDAEGRGRFEPLFDRALVQAERDGLRSKLVEVKRSQTETVLELLRDGYLEGRVLDSDSQPVGGARVTVRSNIELLAREATVLESDVHGGFSCLLPGAWHAAVVSARQGERETASEGVVIRPGALSEVTLRFSGKYSIRLRLRSEGGGPVEGFSFLLTRLGEPSVQIFSGWQASLSASDLEVDRPGGYRVTAWSDGHGAAGADVELTPAEPIAKLELTLPLAGEILGRVRWPDGTPVESILVSHRRTGPIDPQGIGAKPAFAERSEKAVLTDEGGRFRLFPIDSAALYLVWCQPDEELPDARLNYPNARAGDFLDLVVSEGALRGGVIRGRVTSRESEEPLPYFEANVIEHEPIEGRHPRLEIGKKLPFREGEGVLEIGGLIPGRSYWVRAWAPEHGQAYAGPVEATREGGHVDIVLDRPSRVVLTILGREGQLARNAHVRLEHWPPLLDENVRRGTVDLAGQLTFDEVSAGDYRIHVSFGGRGYGPLRLTVPAGTNVEHEVKLQSPSDDFKLRRW